MKRYLLIISIFFSTFFSFVRAEEIDLDAYQSMVSDSRSFRVGEPIVVVVVETTLAEASAATGVETSRGISAGATGGISKLGSAAVDIDSSSEGAGKTSRKGKVSTQLSATIEEVQANGLLKIKGVQNIIINGESQKITMTGFVRAKDISKDNSIFSSQIANVNFQIDGDGKLKRAQKENIIYRLMNWLGVL